MGTHTSYIDPASDVSVACHRSAEDANYKCVDDGVRSPDAPGNDNVYANHDDGALTDIYGVGTGIGTYFVTRIDIYAYYEGVSAGDELHVDVSVDAGSSWEGAKELVQGDIGPRWNSDGWDFLAEPIDFDDLQIKATLTADPLDTFSIEMWEIYARVEYVILLDSDQTIVTFL